MQFFEHGACLNIEISSSQYRISHYKDKTVSIFSIFKYPFIRNNNKYSIGHGLIYGMKL